MTRKPPSSASDFDPAVMKLFDQYVHGQLDRRGFLDKAARFAVGGVSAAALLEALSPKFAEAQQVPANDARIKTRYAEVDSPKGYGKVRGYLAEPAAGNERRPSVLVIHENRGLNPHIEDIARRLALDGFNAYAPDALFPLGGYPGNEDKARELFGKLDQGKTIEDFVAAANYVRGLPEGNGRLGAVGFCYGGSTVNELATRLPDLNAVVPFYGTGPASEKVAAIKAPLLLNFAGNDQRVNATWPGYEAALKASGVRYEAFFYPAVEHGFNNDSTPRYDSAAATLAWKRTIDFFNKNLRAQATTRGPLS